MIISIIVAMDEAGGIGKNGTLPWRLRTDLQRFKRITLGHSLIMGRKTFDSIGRPLPGRTNIIITRNRQFAAPGCRVTNSLKMALQIANESNEQEVFVIGGGQIFEQSLALADRIYLTCVHTISDSQVFFPPLDWARWQILEQEQTPAGEQDEFATTFYLLQRASVV